jgi:hypothetical protein
LEVRVALVKVSNQRSAFEIPDLDSRVSGSAQPVTSWAEGKSIDDVTSFEGIQVLSFVEIPEANRAILTTRSTQGTIRGNSDGVDVSRVASQVGSQLAVAQVPDLNELIPTSRDNHWVAWVRRETDGANPFSVSLFFNGVLAFSQSVPQLNGLISGTRDDLSVVSREGNTQNVLGVSDETTSGGSKVEVPQSQSRVPRTREGELTIRGDSQIRNEVGVSVKGLLWSTIVLLRFTGQVPDDDGLISGSRQEHIRIFSRCAQAGDPVRVSLQDSSHT